MKKFTHLICTILALSIMLGSMTVLSFAAYDTNETLLEPEYVGTNVFSDDESASTRASTVISFSNLGVGYCKKSTSTYYITSGDDVMTITAMSWSPSGQDISVAFMDATTGATYAIGLSGGSAANVKVTTKNVPTGEYYVAVVNYDGPKAVSGSMTYSF